MANQKKTIDYEIQFRTNQLSLQNVNKVFRLFFDNFKFSDLLIINNSTKTKATKDLLEIRETANTVEAALTAAFNPKLGITNIDTFKNSLKTAGTSIEQVRAAFDKAGGAGTLAFLAMANSLTNVRLKATESESIIDKMGETLKRTLTWSVSSSIINKMAGSIQEAYGYVKHLDSSLNDIRIVTEYSAEAMDKFAEKANKAAITLGKSTTDYTEAALIYYQQGLGETDVAARTDVTLKTANVTLQSTAQVSEELTAIWNGYKVNAEEAEAYIDKVAKVAAVTAADLEEMATGMSKVASAANVMGVDIDQMNAILATTISVTRQAPESVGAAYKTIFARMSLIQAGEETEDGATLKSYTEQMAAMGVSVLDANNKLRDMGDIIEEVGNKWLTWNREQQIAFALIAAGTRLYNNLIALFDNWGMYEKTLEESKNALGTLLTQQDIYMESTAAHLLQLRTAAEGIYDSLINAKDINSVVDVFTGWAKGIETVVDGLGGLKGVLSVIGPLMINAFSSNIGQIMSLTFSNFTVKEENLVKILLLEASILNLKNLAPETTQKYLLMKESLAGVANGIKPELFNKISDSIEKQATIESEINKINTDIENNSKRIALAKREIGDAAKRQEEREILINQLKEEQLKLTLKLRLANLENTEAAKKQLEELNTIYRTDSAGRLHLQSTAETEAGLRALGIRGYGSAAHANRLKVMAELNSYGITDESLLKGKTYAEIAEKINNAVKERKKILEEILKSEDKIENIKKMMPQLSDEEVDKLAEINDLEIEGKNLEEAKVAILKRLQTELAELLKLLREGVRLIGEGIGQAASAITGFIGAFDLIKNVFKILDNDDLTTLEKFKLTLAASAAAVTALMMAFGTAGRAISSFRSATETLLKVQKALNTSTTLQEALTKLNTKAEKENSTAKIENAGATGADTAAKEADTIVTGQEKVVIDAETTSILANKMARLGLIAVIGLAAAAIIAYTIYVESGAKAEHDLKKAAEASTKAYEKLKEVLLEIKEKQENLKNLVDTYKELKKALDDLVKGTEEWNTQMDSLAATVDKLLDDYPELIRYALYDPSTNTYSINESKLKEFLENQERETLKVQLATDKSAYYDARSLIEYYSKLTEKYQGYLELLQYWEDKEIDARRKFVNDYVQYQNPNKDYNYETFLIDAINAMRESGMVAGGPGVQNEYLSLQIAKLLALNEGKYWDRKNATFLYGEDILKNNPEEFEKIYLSWLKQIKVENGKVYLQTGTDENGNAEYKELGLVKDYAKEIGADISLASEITELSAETVKEAIDAGITSLELLPGKLANLYREGSSKEMADKYKNQLLSKTLQDFFQEIYNKYGDKFSSLDYEKLKSNIENAVLIDPDHGLERLREAIYKAKDLTATVDFDLKQVEDNLQLKLDDAKIELSIFEDKKLQLLSYGIEADDDTIIRLIQSQEKLNNIYKERETIFTSLSKFENKKFEWEKATDKDIQYARDITLALNSRYGTNLGTQDYDFVIEHLEDIEEFLNGSEEAARRLAYALSLIKPIENVEENLLNIRDTFSDLILDSGEVLNQSSADNIIKWAEELLFTEEEIEKLFNSYGYRKTDEGWVYDKKLYIAMNPSFKADRTEYLKSAESQWLLVSKDYNNDKKAWADDNGYQLDENDNVIIPETIDIEAKVLFKNDVVSFLNDFAKQALPWDAVIKSLEEDLKSKGLLKEFTLENIEVWKKLYLAIIAALTTFLGEDSSTKQYSMSTANHELITPETPKLDTTDSDNKLKLLKQDIQDYKDVLSSLIPGTEAYADAEERLNKANDDYLKTIDEKIAKTKDYIATNKAAATASVEAATGVKVQFGENGLVTNWEDIKKAVGDSTGYNAAAAEHAAAKEKLNNAFEVDEEGNQKAKYAADEMEKLKQAEKTADEKAKLAKLNYDAEIKGLQESVKWLEEVDKATSTLTDLERERNKVIKDTASYYGKLAEDTAKMTGEQKAKYDDLTYSIEKTNQALEKLGDADAFSGQNLVDYYNTYNDLVNQNTENLKALNIDLEENNKAREDLINGLLRYAGVKDIKFEKRDDGTYNTSALENQLRTRIGELLNEGTVEATTEAEKLLGVLDSILKIAGGINDNIETTNNNTDKINKNVSETARAAASMTFAKVNKELDDITRKLDLAKAKVEDAKTIFDKSGGMGSLSAFDDWKREYEDYLNWLDLQGDKYREKINTLFNLTYVLDILKGADGENIFNLFNAKTKEDFLNGYWDYANSLDTIKEKIKKKMEDLDEEIKNAAPGQNMDLQQEELAQLTVAFEMLADAEEYATQRKKEYIDLKIDTKEVLNLKKEWLTAAIDRLIKAVNRELSLLLKLQSRLKGKDVITNLQQQVDVIQKLIALEQRKLGVLLSEAKIQQVIIQGMVARMGISGAIFDANGDINAAFLDKMAKSAHITNEEFQTLLGLLKNYKSLMSEIESQQDAIVSLQDEIADKQYEISEKIYEETRKEAEKLLNKFKIEIEVELNEAEMMRKIDRLRAKVAAMPAWDLAGAMGLDIGDAVSYATKDVDILTNAVNKLIVDYQSDAWKDFYDTLKDAYDDIISYANQLTSAVESFYDALDTARLKYSEAIDKVISANQELIDDLEEMKKISKHGINITKMLFGENSYEDLTTYYKKIQKTTREQLQAAKEQAAYYKALLATIDPMKHPDEYESVKSALKSAIDETYTYAEEMGNQALEEMNAKIEDAARKLKDEFARVLGYENSTMQDLAHDYQLKILNDYLDTTESLYEMVTLLNKFTKAINDTTSASEKSKLSKVMKEQVGYLQLQVEKTGRLTKYEVDRANMMYDLTLKLMALEEARDNKTKMRLRRDSQGNYRYEYIADAEKTAEAQQDLLELQYKIYELDKKRLLELYDEKEKLIEDFNLKYIDIINNQYMTEAEKELALNELKEQYYGENGYLIQLGRDYAEAVHNIDESADGELDKILEDIIEETGRTSEEILNNFIDVANAMDNFANEGLAALDLYTTDVLDALALLTDGLGDLEAAVDMDINTIMELADVDLELIDVWMELVDVCGDLMAQLEELEEYYRGVMLAALDAAEAAAKLKVTDLSTADERKKTEETTITSTGTPGGSSASASATGTKSTSKKKSTDDTGYLTGYALYVNGKVVGFSLELASDNKDVYGMNSDEYLSKYYQTNYEVPGLDDLKRMKKGYSDEGATTKLVRYVKKYDTGGYTGEWGSDGRLAMLHLKELVLNQNDTANLLSAVDIMRTLQDNIEQILNYANTMSPNFNVSAPSSDLNQNVKIEASFPGVTNSREIEDAFNNLVNLASQRAMSTRR